MIWNTAVAKSLLKSILSALYEDRYGLRLSSPVVVDCFDCVFLSGRESKE